MVLWLIPRSPRCTGLVGHRRPTQAQNLIPASGDQDHTALPSALVSLVRRHPRVHSIPLLTSVTIAIRPSSGSGMATINTIWISDKANYFRRHGLTGFAPVSPTGKSVLITCCGH